MDILLLKKIDEKKEILDGLKPLSETQRALLQEKLRIEWTYNSNAIEGNTLSLKETSFFIREGLTVEGKPLKDFLEAKNHIEAIGFVENAVVGKREITESFIKELNALVLKGINKIARKSESGQIFEHTIHPGEYKKEPNYVLTLSGDIHRYVEPMKVVDEMQNLIKWYNEAVDKIHPVELAAEFHYKFIAIHPFDDCNGRTARLLMNVILMKNFYPLAIIPVAERRRYLESLEKANQGDLTDFKNFVAEKVLATAQTMVEILK